MGQKRLAIIAKAPSSAMLFGEHAVLRGKTACVAAIDRYLTVRLSSRSDMIVAVKSSLASCETRLDTLSFPYELRFVEAALKSFQPQLLSGYDIEIHSDVPHTVGLGSSASVTVAMIAALLKMTHNSLSVEEARKETLKRAINVIREVQGSGSGADAASIVYGGVISFRMDGVYVERLTEYLPLSLFYCGYKTPTAKVIETISKAEVQEPEIYSALFEALERVTLQAVEAIREKDLYKIGKYMNIANGLMESLGVSTHELSTLIWQARACDGVYGAKISGSGLGDSIAVVGSLNNNDSDMCKRSYIPGSVSSVGVQAVVE